MEYQVEVLKKLKQKKSFKTEELLKEFKMTKKDFYNLLLVVVEKEIKNLDFDSCVDKYKYLYKVFKYFDELEDVNIIKDVSRKIKQLRVFCDNKLDKAVKEGKADALFDNVFYKLIDIFDVTLLKLNFNLNTTDLDKNDLNSKNYIFLKELIFDIGNYNYVYEAFKTSRNLMYTKSPSGQSLLEELIDYYIQTVKNSHENYEIIYIEKIIKLFLTSDKFKIEKQELVKLNNKLLLSIDNLKREKIKRHEISRISFFLNEIIQDLKDNDAKNNIDDIDYKFGIQKDFSLDALEEAEKFYVIDDHKYIDMKDKFVITIDSPGTQIFDDACSFEKLKDGTYLLGVYVADVDTLVRPNSALDLEALKRAESIYLPLAQVPMFPYELSNKLSLVQNQKRPAIGYFFLFDTNMNVIDFKTQRVIVNVNHNLDYNAVTNEFHTSHDIKLYETLKQMLWATEMIKTRTGVDPSYQTVKNIKRCIMNGKNTDTKYGEGSILATFIVTMNHYVAEYFDKLKYIPFPYHVNLAAYEDNVIKELQDKFHENSDIISVIDCLKEIYIPSYYSTINFGHKGLKLSAYANASNPLRQYVSLITSRLVKRHIIDGIEEPMIDLASMNNICEQINNRIELNLDYKNECAKVLSKNKSAK